MSGESNLDRTPRRATDLWRRFPDGSAALLNLAGQFTRLNATAFLIWQMADGQRTVDDIAVAFAQAVGRDSQEIVEDVVQALDEMQRHQVLVVDWRPL